MNDLVTLWVPLAVLGLGVLLLLVDVLTPPKKAAQADVGWLVAVGLLVIFGATFLVDVQGVAAYGAYRTGPWALFFQRLFLVAGALAAFGGVEDVQKRTPGRQGEYWLMMLFSLSGMVLVPGAQNLLLVVVAFELMSIPLYVLAAHGKTDPDEASAKGNAAEAAVKLYFVGALSTAFTLFGLGLLTGLTGTTELARIGAAPLQPLAALGLLFVLGGLGYKIGMVPFHMWVPDTYQGARAPFVAFLSVAPKAAGLAVIAGIFAFGMQTQKSLWVGPLGMAAFLSMAIGNLLAVTQSDTRRLLGYSGVAQMGYVLIALATGEEFGLAMVLFFLVAYLFTNLGAFLVVHANAEAGAGFEVDGLAGLSRRAPKLALALACFLLSLAGIPFVVGFWAKLYVLLAAYRAGLVSLVVAGVVLAVIGLFYYLRLLRAAYMTEPTVSRPDERFGGPALGLAIALCVVAVVGLGLFPKPLLDAATRASHDLGVPAAAPHVGAR
ncbi:MAG: NADH-quinone oxidoreductase subunit N [Myxococcales bacterium]|nr:NADH-quinone oxidoreductase subunit N [Myxococcales bacterium]